MHDDQPDIDAATLIGESDDVHTIVVARRSPLAVRPSAMKIYVFLPILFLAVTLLGGLRLGAVDSAFVFLKPALICLIFASALMIMIIRAGLISAVGFPMIFRRCKI